MKKILGLVLAFLIIATPIASASTAIGGKVVYVKTGCDYYIVADSSGYDLLEWFGGHIPLAGDVLAGDIHSFGIKDILIGSSVSTATKGRAWIEDYWLSADSVVGKFIDKCHLNTPSTVSSYNTYTPSSYTYNPTYSYPSYYGNTSTSSGLSNDNYYTNAYGNTVHSPVYSITTPSSASAQCNDGTYSFSQSRSGTCSHHGGVASWY